MSYALSTQPESYGQIILRSIQLYKAGFYKIFFEALLLAFICFLPRILAHFGYLSNPMIHEWSSFQSLFLILINIIALAFFTALLWRMRCVIQHVNETAVSDIKITIRKLPLIIGGSLIQTAIQLFMFFTSIGVFKFFVEQYILNSQPPLQLTQHPLHAFLISTPVIFQTLFNIYIFFLFIFYLPLILTEHKAIINALIKSAKLVWKNWWRTFTVLLTPWLCYLIILLLVLRITGCNTPFYFFQPSALPLPLILFQVLMFTLFIPWFAATLLVQLRDLELRQKISLDVK